MVSRADWNRGGQWGERGSRNYRPDADQDFGTQSFVPRLFVGRNGCHGAAARLVEFGGRLHRTGGGTAAGDALTLCTKTLETKKPRGAEQLRGFFYGGREGGRTHDLYSAIVALSQLSYTPTSIATIIASA